MAGSGDPGSSRDGSSDGLVRWVISTREFFRSASSRSVGSFGHHVSICDNMKQAIVSESKGSIIVNNSSSEPCRWLQCFFWWHCLWICWNNCSSFRYSGQFR
jgi:hypothetical protein